VVDIMEALRRSLDSGTVGKRAPAKKAPPKGAKAAPARGVAGRKKRVS
jgi:hypothetical protein